MWALGFARRGKLFEKMQTSSFGTEFSTHEFFSKMQPGKKHDIFPYKAVLSFFPKKNWSFFDKPFKKFGENMLFYKKFNIFVVLGIKFNNSFMKRHGKKTLIQRIFMDELTQIHQNFKISNIPITIF
jgi:hypothetical protein